MAELEQRHNKTVSKEKRRDSLISEIVSFLYSCGKDTPYSTEHHNEIVECVTESVYNDQYLVERFDNGNIKYYISYWKITEKGLVDICNGIKPAVKTAGDIVYIVDCGNMGGQSEFRKSVRVLKNTFHHICWHRWGKKGVRLWVG